MWGIKYRPDSDKSELPCQLVWLLSIIIHILFFLYSRWVSLLSYRTSITSVDYIVLTNCSGNICWYVFGFLTLFSSLWRPWDNRIKSSLAYKNRPHEVLNRSDGLCIVFIGTFLLIRGQPISINSVTVKVFGISARRKVCLSLWKGKHIG